MTVIDRIHDRSAFQWSAGMLDTVDRRFSDLVSPGAKMAVEGNLPTDRDLPSICPEWSALMASAQNGDRSAYRRLLTEISDLVRCWARSYGIDGPTCEELVCNILRTLHRVRHTYQPNRPFMPWLLGVLRCEVGKQGYRVRDLRCDLKDHIGQTAERASDFATSAEMVPIKGWGV